VILPISVRFVSAVFLGTICSIPFYFGGVAWAILVAVFSAVMMWEWVNMSDPAPTRLAFLIPILGLALVIYGLQSDMALTAIGGAAIATLLVILERARRGGFLWAGFGFLYILIPSLVIIALRGDAVGFSARGFSQAVFVILVVAAADTGAYFGGSYFKGPKLVPRLSPNKTWSGLLSGVISGAIFGVILAALIGFSPVLGAVLSVPIVLVSVLGDFLESGLKRVLKVKDAGSVMPGHGGLLDRLDSLMLAICGAALVLHVYPAIWPV